MTPRGVSQMFIFSKMELLSATFPELLKSVLLFCGGNRDKRSIISFSSL